MNELSPEAKQLFALAREASAEDAARLAKARAALGARIAAPNAAGAAAAEATATGASATATVAWGTTIVIGISVAVAALSAITMRGARVESVAQPVAEARATAVVGAAAAAPPKTTVRRERATPSGDVDHREPRTRALRRTARPVTASRRPHADVAEQRRNVPAAEPMAAPGNERAPAEPREHAKSREAEPSTSVAAPAAPPARVDDSFARELALVRQASAALARKDAARALALLEQHADSHPHGTLRQERFALRALSLCALGRTLEAGAATAELERIAPRSPHLMRLRGSCAAPRR